jgi:DNA polymerase-4
VTVIAHADMDAFYASIEQRDNPELRGKPVAVGYSGKRGVVTAASYEARRFGVKSAMPMITAKRLCKSLVIVPGRMRVYAETSAKIRDVFYRYTPIVEPLSLDEAYLELSGSLKLFGPARSIAELIRTDIRKDLGLPVSIGIGAGKLTAKIASRRAKPDGVFVVEENETKEFLRPAARRGDLGRGKEDRAHAARAAHRHHRPARRRRSHPPRA